MVSGVVENPPMKKARRPLRRKLKLARLEAAVLTDGDLYIGEWIKFMGKRQGQVAKDADINEGYLSQLISGKYDKDPSLSMLKTIAGAIGVPVGALFHSPPTREQVVQGYRTPWAS